MATQAEQLAELQSLNAQLGLAEDDGMPLTYEQKVQELRALDEQLASTPESFGEYVERRKVEDSRSLGDKTAAFTESFMTGAGALASEGSKAISELFAGDVGTSEVGGVFQVGINDFGRFAETLGGAAMDNFYSDEGEMQREYQRYKDNFLYNQEVRPAMLETYDEEGRDFVSFGANFVDPALLVPAAGLIAKGGSLGAKAVALGAKAGAFAARSPRLVQLSKAMARTSRGAEKVAKGLDKASEVASIPAKLAASGTRKAIKGSAFIGSKIAGGVGRTGEAVSKVAALPRNLATKLIPKLDPKTAGAVAATAQVGAATQGMVPGLGILTSAEILGFLANKTGRGVERTLSALSSTGGQKRFLQRLATTAESKTVRKSALMAHAGGATKLTDLAFNSLVNGASVGVLNGALAYASGEGAEGVGAAVGSGTLMGGSLPFGQPGMKGGKSQAARDQSSINFLNAKLADDQIKQFKNLSPEARLAFATVEEAGIRAPKLAFLDKKTYLDFLRQDDPNLRQAPNAHYDMGDNTIYVNQDGNAGRSSKEAMDILTHELGHHFITQGIKDDPLFARKILEQYEAKPGEESFDFAFTTDSAGSPIDSIQLNADAKKISDGYDSIQSGDQSISVGMNANKLAQEIGAEQFAMMMVDNPNIFNTIEPSLRQKLLDGSRKVLTMFGAVDPYTGNPLDISISPILKRNKQVRNLYKNYIKQREKSIVDKVDLAEKGVAIKVRKGESADQAVERMFGAQGISLKDSGAFRITNKKVKEKLSQILNRLDEQPEGPMSSERNPRSDKPQSIVGKELSPELKNVFTRNDPRGTINVLINDITESIRDRIQLNFLYRSGKPSKYSDNELKGRVVSPVRFKVTGLSKGSRSAASLKMDAIDEAYLRNNVEVLVKEGFAKDPNKLIEQAREVARQALDNEGKINPEGNFENELITAVFGQKESAPQIKDARLRELLAAKDSKLQHAYRSYDIDALAGIAPTGKSGIAFDWFNIKNNYSPFDDKLFIPAFHGTPHTLAPEAGAPLGKFRTSAVTEKLFMPASEAGATKGKPTQGDTTLASVQSWDGPNPTFKASFTKGMAKDNKEAAALLRKSYEDQFGEPLRAQDFTEEQVNWLGDMLAKEGEAALGRTGNAVNWYTSAVERALSVAEEIFPDIGQKYEAKDRFLGALSITSQNMRVMDNAKGAVKQYQHKERTGKFDYSIKHGAKADAITQNLKLYDQAEAKMGVKDLHEFLDTDFTVKELSQWGKSFFGNKKFSIAGYNTDMVKGSAIFGPKIGQGFFQNLRGNYNPVTVDLWLRRTFGRLTGLALDTELKAGDIGRLIYSVRKNVGKRKFSGLELPEFLKGVSISGKVQGNGVANFKISDQTFNRLFGDNTIGRDNFEAVYDFAGKLNKEWERRFATAGNDVTKAKKAIKAVRKEKKSTTNLEKKLAKLEVEKEAIGKEKPQWAKAGSTVSDKLKPIDIPSNAERAVITKSFNVALKTLRDKGIDLTPADLQATLWYPEKDIWAFLKGENSDALNMSYDTAMEVIRDQR